MKKQELRKIYKEKRKELTTTEIEQFEKSIYMQIEALDWSKIEVVHLFLSIERYKEINTYPIVTFLREKQKVIVISKSDFKANTLSHFLFDENTQIEVNSYGIPEPINAKEISPKEIDLVFVPLLVSDENKYRVGYGKGFYDRFLSDCRKDVKTIGLNFFKPIDKIEDINQYDVALDHVIYPK